MSTDSKDLRWLRRAVGLLDKPMQSDVFFSLRLFSECYCLCHCILVGHCLRSRSSRAFSNWICVGYAEWWDFGLRRVEASEVAVLVESTE